MENKTNTPQVNVNMDDLLETLQALNALGKQPQCLGVGRYAGMSPTRQLDQYLTDDDPERLEWLLAYLTERRGGTAEFPLDGGQVRLYACYRYKEDKRTFCLKVGGIDRDRYPNFYGQANSLLTSKGYGY